MRKHVVFLGVVLAAFLFAAAVALPTIWSRASKSVGSPTAAVPTIITSTASPALQVPWTPAGFTPQANGLVDWDHELLIAGWEHHPGLSAKDVLYVQSGVPRGMVIPNLPFVIPNGQTLIFGAVSGELSERNSAGEVVTYAYGNGFYAARPAGTEVTNLSIQNGFALFVSDGEAIGEFCSRVAQAYAEDWARDNIFHSPLWSAPVCSGVYSVPLDSDR